jgi:hypothetical protein
MTTCSNWTRIWRRWGCCRRNWSWWLAVYGDDLLASGYRLGRDRAGKWIVSEPVVSARGHHRRAIKRSRALKVINVIDSVVYSPVFITTHPPHGVPVCVSGNPPVSAVR